MVTDWAEVPPRKGGNLHHDVKCPRASYDISSAPHLQIQNDFFESTMLAFKQWKTHLPPSRS